MAISQAKTRFSSFTTTINQYLDLSVFIKVSSTKRTFAGVGRAQCSCVNEELFIASTICNKRRDIV
ncbi:MAG: hypothetical protein ACTSXT_00225, partial [Candidatus Helarchaeota archaeon]